MGWIDIVERQQKDLSSLAVLGGDVRSAGFKSALLLGMGGSSLCPEVLAKTFGQQPDFPALHIVDSTDPAQVMAACEAVDLGEALVIVASKSGTTLEPNILKQFFYEQVRRVVGAENVGSHFVAITDPGSKMEQVAKDDGFRYIFYGDPQIGGRYSALSNFGVVAATVAGLKVGKLLDEAAKGVASAKEPVQNNPGVQLGLLLGSAANAGRDKITIFTSPEILRSGRVAGATDRRIHRQAGQGNYAGGSRGHWRARGVWQRPRFCLRAPEEHRRRARASILTPRLRLWRLPGIQW